MINIRSDINDRFYRYKMPKIISKIEGKGNGIKTVIPNMADIAKALSRPPAYPTKFFGSELGTQSKCDDKNDKYVINGSHDANKLQTILDAFIQKFVLCQKCLNPETDLIITQDKNPNILRICKACGASSECDLRHKLCVFIIKNPPPVSKATTKAIKAQQESTDRVLPAESSQTNTTSDSKKDLEDEDGGGDEKLEEFAEYVEGLDWNDVEFSIRVFEKSQDLGLAPHKTLQILIHMLIVPTKIISSFTAHSALFHTFRSQSPLKCSKVILGALEVLISEGKFLSEKDGCEELQGPSDEKVSKIFKLVYDLELLEEDVLFAWEEKLSKRYVDKKTAKEIRVACEPFLSWLKYADIEEE